MTYYQYNICKILLKCLGRFQNSIKCTVFTHGYCVLMYDVHAIFVRNNNKKILYLIYKTQHVFLTAVYTRIKKVRNPRFIFCLKHKL